MLQEAIHKLVERTDLSKQESYECVLEIMSGNASESLIAAFLTALRMKGETVQEISGAALAMREKSTRIVSRHSTIIDTCGTGGDGLGTFNISTASAIVAASAGAIVAKHGNRAVSSKSGSADVLKALGVNIDIPKERVEASLDEIGIGFLFAPMLHGAMKYAAPVRKELGMRTIFNLLGPLTNPAGAKRQLMGVYRRGLTEVLANVLLDLGTERAMVVHGYGGMDEMTVNGETRISEVSNGRVTTTTFQHESAGLPASDLSDISGGDAAENAAIILAVFEGKSGAPRDIIALNAGAALAVAGIASSIAEGVAVASDAIASGAARKKLNQLIEFTHA
ncbi:MAG: anthranilate phosphoribosyltransferase [Bacteroidetes bacterium]|nr:anthranilate phosphoribosyltransferase [Bacteroidota bacterium]